MGSVFSSDANVLHLSGNYLQRPRLHRLFEDAMDYPLIVVCAGSGYGKTRAVLSFLQEYDAYTTWMQISERDNIATRYWERYANVVSLSRPEAGARLLQIGFPDTEEKFAIFCAMVREVGELPQKHVMVFDDFHLLHNPTVTHFIERTADIFPQNASVILISRTTPDINLIDMMMRERIVTISEDMLCFTEDEISDYFSLLKLPVSGWEVRNIYDDTQGWAFAINLIGRSLAKEQKYERYALEAMKKNIFRLIEAEISQTVSPRLWRFLLHISLVDHLAASLISVLAKDGALIKEMELLNAYIRYDFNMDTYMIHHLFLDYLRQQVDILPDEEKRGVYREAGAWCKANGLYADALSYYEKSADYQAVTRIIAAFNMQIPQDMARYALEICERAPATAKSDDPIFPAMHLKLRMSLGQLDETDALARGYAADYEARPDSAGRDHALAAIYAIWALVRLKMCTYTDVYDFDIYYQKMGECFEKNPFQLIGAFNSISVSAWASLVGVNRAGAQEEYLNAVSRAIPYVSRVAGGALSGFDDLVRGELYFYRGEFDDAEQYLKQAIDKAQPCDQYVTLNRALVYLMLTAFFRGDFASATARLAAIEALLEKKDYGVRFETYDIARGFYHLALEQPEQMPEWLKGDFSPHTHPYFLENYANRIKEQYHYLTHQYHALLAFIEKALAQPAILFGKIELKVLAALSLYRLRRREESFAALTEAYQLAAPDNIIVLFTKYAKDMRMLTAAALREDTCNIPKAWLENINRKSSAFAKRKAHMLSRHMTTNHLVEGVALTEREIAILRDLSQGLSRTEIASRQNISAAIIKTIINIIYEKLCVNSLPEAIRVAVDRKII